jgi:hypothetical protein
VIDVGEGLKLSGGVNDRERDRERDRRVRDRERETGRETKRVRNAE